MLLIWASPESHVQVFHHYFLCMFVPTCMLFLNWTTNCKLLVYNNRAFQVEILVQVEIFVLVEIFVQVEIFVHVEIFVLVEILSWMLEFRMFTDHVT